MSSPKHHMRARGRLTYLEFIRTVSRVWEDSHPDIPIVPSGIGERARYPCIVYGLERRVAHPDDPKPRFREVIDDDGNNTAYIISSQRFQSIVSFESITEEDPLLAEEIIEAFEIFMTEITPILKEMGASELVYARRYSDTEDARRGQGTVGRKVAYQLTTERSTISPVDRMEAITVSARTAQRIPDEEVAESQSVAGESPRYYTVGGLHPNFYITETSKTSNQIVIPYSFFRIGDIVYMAAGPDGKYPENLIPGYYTIASITGTPYEKEVLYEITRRGDNTIITDFGADTTNNARGFIYSGKAFYSPDNVFVEIKDDANV